MRQKIDARCVIRTLDKTHTQPFVRYPSLLSTTVALRSQGETQRAVR